VGHEETRNTDKQCFDVLLFKVKSDGVLELIQKETYRCDVEADEMRSDEHSFFYPYRIDEEKGRIEFTFAPH
jgi:hypothetical protein